MGFLSLSFFKIVTCKQVTGWETKFFVEKRNVFDLSSSAGSNPTWAQRPLGPERTVGATAWRGLSCPHRNALPRLERWPSRDGCPSPHSHWLVCVGGAGRWLRAGATPSGRIPPSPCLPGGEATDQEFDFPSPSSGSLVCVPRLLSAHSVALEGACGAGCRLSRAARDAPVCGPGKAALRGAVRTRLWVSQIRSKMTSSPSCPRGLRPDGRKRPYPDFRRPSVCMPGVASPFPPSRRGGGP